MREVMLIFHFIGLAMGLGTGFAHAFLGTITAKMTPDEAIKFRMHSLVLGNMGHIGMVLLIISGLYLIIPFWGTISYTPLLMLKLALVAVLVILLILINAAAKRAQKGNAEVELKKMEKFGKMTLPVALAIVILAVNIFH